MCTHYIASELHPSFPHLFTILCSSLCFKILFTEYPVWITGDSSTQIALQIYLTAVFKEIESIEKHKSL